MSGMVWSYGATVTKQAVAFSPVAVIAMQDGVDSVWITNFTIFMSIQFIHLWKFHPIQPSLAWKFITRIINSAQKITSLPT